MSITPITHRFRSLLVLTGVFGALILAFAGPAAASTANPEDDDQVVLHGTLVVPEGQTVHTAVIFDGPVTIAGTVTESLVVFNGNVDITGTVDNDVVVFNGDVVVRSGATVGGDIVSTATATVEPGATVGGTTKRFSGRFDWGKIGLASKIAWWIMFSVSALFLGLILLVLAPGLDGAITRGRERRAASIGIGVAWFFLLPVVSALLLVTVVGTPLGLFMLLGLGLLYTVGYVAGAMAVGRMLVKAPTSRYVAFLAGLGLLRLLALVPVVAGIVFTLASILGFGVLVIAARRTRTEAPAPVEPPPMPA